MEAEENSASMKRQREPLSDSEDNVLVASEGNDFQKRRRLEASGQENRSPKPSSGRSAELETKPDTPIVPSVRSRVQLLTQRRDGAPVAQRCFSDPGADGLSPVGHGGAVREHLLGEGEFNQRMERFKAPAPAPPAGLTPPQSPSSCPRTRSGFVSDIQQKLQHATTPSSKQASLIRQEREQELNLLCFQPISENAWLKRSSSDSSLTQQAPDDPEMKDGSFSEVPASGAQNSSVMTTDAGSSCHDETNTAELIEQMFEEVLEYAGRVEEKRKNDEDAEDHDSGIGACSGGKTDEEEEKEKDEVDSYDKDGKFETSGDELLTFPPSGILSPLSKSMEAVVTPLRLAASELSNPPSLLLTPEETSTPPAEPAPLYSIDAYRTQRQSQLPSIQSVTPAVQRRAPETSKPHSSINTKDKITALSEEAGRLQTIISQTLQALSCCTDEEHGRGSLEEAEAEKLLLVSCEKRSALLAEVSRLREERSCEEAEPVSQQPCRGNVSISDIRLPLKVEFVCSSHSRAGRPSHYFFVLIRYGPCNMVATPLATAADALHGDTISFPTSVTLRDIRSSFEVDVEVYSLSHTAGSLCGSDRTSSSSSSSSRARVTPRKLLSSITQRAGTSLSSGASGGINPRRSSSFCLVGSHKLSLDSLGHSKFPLDKMKFEGKIRRLLGDEFQEKVPFLSPLEGNIYLQLHSEGHSRVRHHGFLTMFELVGGFGVWQRRYFLLDGPELRYWSRPADRGTTEAIGCISLSRSANQSVRPVKRDSCARPFTFELVSSVSQSEDQNRDQNTLAKCWFSADTKQERLDWMEKLNQALLDFHTWKQRRRSGGTAPALSSRGSVRDSVL